MVLAEIKYPLEPWFCRF